MEFPEPMGSIGWFWSVLCIFLVPSIYSMEFAGRARLDLRAR